MHIKAKYWSYFSQYWSEKDIKKFSQNFIYPNYNKMIFTDECVFKGEKQRCRNSVHMKKSSNSLQCTQNEKWIYG